MPDWSYTVLGPLLKAAPRRHRAFVMRALGRAAGTRAGGRIVEIFGHTRPPDELAVVVGDLRLPSLVGAAADAPGGPPAAPLLARFGMGFVEVDARDADAAPDPRVPLAARLPDAPVADQVRVARRLAHRVAFFTAPPGPVLREVAAATQRPVFARVSLAHEAREVRARFGAHTPIVAAGDIKEPADALALLDAGATLVALGRGLADAGPGLPKRIHEAIRHRASPAPAARPAWWWGPLLLGLGMIVAGSVVGAVGATRVVLPYDEAFVGVSREELAAASPRLLPFLMHDRVTLAGTMISIGILYAALAWHAQRRGERWAKVAIAASGLVGFASFFLYLGFGYFDPLHALVSLLLLPLFVFGLLDPARAPPAVPAPDLRNDGAWRFARWGQLSLVALALGLVGAGAYIAVVGSTRVFVPEDLAFLRGAPTGRLLALTAHDRAGLGGALASDGLAVLLVSMWGIRRGARWVWWALLASGAVGFAGAIGVHYAVGYVDARHLAPAFLALALFVAGLALTAPFLLRRARAPAAPP